jgi:hypothetical protein
MMSRFRRVLMVGAMVCVAAACTPPAAAHDSGTTDYQVTAADVAGSSTSADWVLIARAIVARDHDGATLTTAEANDFAAYLQRANRISAPQVDTLVDYRPNRVPAGTPPTTTTLPATTTTGAPTSTSTTTTTTVAATTTVSATTTTVPAATTTTAAPTTTAPATTTTIPAPPTSTIPTSSGDFIEDFASPASVDRFVWEQSHGGVDPFPRTDQPREWQADHDTMCGAPPTLRTVHLHGSGGYSGPGPIATATGDNAFWCAPGAEAAKGHVMTSTVLTAYGHIDFSPARSFTNVRQICWDMNRSDLGGRKWWQVSIIPEAAFQANGGHLDYVRPNLEGDGNVAGGSHVLPLNAFQLSTFRTENVFSRGDGVKASAGSEGADLSWAGGEAFWKPASDRANRYRHCLTESAAGVTLTMVDHRGTADPSDDDPWTQNMGTNFHIPQGAVRVIFQDVTYDSIKGDFERGGAPLNTNTWHVDNILIDVA